MLRPNTGGPGRDRWLLERPAGCMSANTLTNGDERGMHRTQSFDGRHRIPPENPTGERQAGAATACGGIQWKAFTEGPHRPTSSMHCLRVQIAIERFTGELSTWRTFYYNERQRVHRSWNAALRGGSVAVVLFSHNRRKACAQLVVRWIPNTLNSSIVHCVHTMRAHTSNIIAK